MLAIVMTGDRFALLLPVMTCVFPTQDDRSALLDIEFRVGKLRYLGGKP